MGKSSRRAKARGHTKVTRALYGTHESEAARLAQLTQAGAAEPTVDPTIAQLRQLELDHLRSRQRRWEQGRDDRE
ncbi:hypothetical protein N865_19675 [Intrasporangium oryzae NRRL B-24470]|uniref:Uncharacterized protein n=1 Tax=Intrasporangium oryzae NRRL B-24470 TaxID=1386089 RepID=W9G1H3_9MICO|nr:hypothetical protein [Intrasporangium oryzae]EWS99940.1 hypothetical protein N865_19675 [Intrasporangium oryzae NRRL B-24470]